MVCRSVLCGRSTVWSGGAGGRNLTLGGLTESGIVESLKVIDTQFQCLDSHDYPDLVYLCGFVLSAQPQTTQYCVVKF